MKNHIDLNCVNKECEKFLSKKFIFSLKFGLESVKAFGFYKKVVCLIQDFDEDLIYKANIEGIGEILKSIY